MTVIISTVHTFMIECLRLRRIVIIIIIIIMLHFTSSNVGYSNVFEHKRHVGHSREWVDGSWVTLSDPFPAVLWVDLQTAIAYHVYSALAGVDRMFHRSW